MRTINALKVADEVWVSAALLHREHRGSPDFAIAEIVARARQEAGEELRPGVYVHVVQHCVANREPDPGRYRMLYETAEGRRRLFRPGDPFHPKRDGSKSTPAREDLSAEYQELLTWYESEYVTKEREPRIDPLLALRGSGKEIWANVHPDDYVRSLREGWE
jgi:hypothetical protein